MKLAGEVLRFGVVGGAATLVHAAVGLGLERFAGLEPWAANIFAFLTALIVSYIGHCVVTFKVGMGSATAFVRFVVLALSGFAVNQTIVIGLTTLAGWSYAASLAVALTVVPAATFVLAKYWALAKPAA